MIGPLLSVTRRNDWLQRKSISLLWGSLAILLGSLVYWRVLSFYFATWPILPPPTAPTWAAALFQMRWGVRGATMLAVMGLVLVEWDGGLLTRLISLTLRNKIRLIGDVVVLFAISVLLLNRRTGTINNPSAR